MVNERPPVTANPEKAGRGALVPIATDPPLFARYVFDVVVRVPVKFIVGVWANDQIDPKPLVLSPAIMAPVDESIANVETPLDVPGDHKPVCEVVNHAPPALLE